MGRGPRRDTEGSEGNESTSGIIREGLKGLGVDGGTQTWACMIKEVCVETSSGVLQKMSLFRIAIQQSINHYMVIGSLSPITFFEV